MDIVLKREKSWSVKTLVHLQLTTSFWELGMNYTMFGEDTEGDKPKINTCNITFTWSITSQFKIKRQHMTVCCFVNQPQSTLVFIFVLLKQISMLLMNRKWNAYSTSVTYQAATVQKSGRSSRLIWCFYRNDRHHYFGDVGKLVFFGGVCRGLCGRLLLVLAVFVEGVWYITILLKEGTHSKEKLTEVLAHSEPP